MPTSTPGRIAADSARGEAMRREGLRIGGAQVATERSSEVFNPYTGALVGTVARASVADVRRALALGKAFRPRLSRYERYRICYQTADALRARTEEIANLITAERGPCKKDSIYEVGRACDVFTFAGNAALQDDGQIFSCDLTAHGKRRKVYTLREPLLGVICAITPFNHPLNQVAHKVAPSIASNNRMVLKPSEKTPLSALLLEKTRAVRYGDPMDPAVDMGTVIDEAAARSFEERVNAAVAHGARLLHGNIRSGALYSPTLLDRVRPEMTLVRQETFGPVSPVMTFRSIDE